MTSISTLVERIRRATHSGEPMRDIAVVVSEFVDDGGIELVDDPFHPARKDRVTGLIAPLSTSSELTMVAIRSAPGVVAYPQRHNLPIAVAVLEGSVVVDVYIESEIDGTLEASGGVEVLPEEVYVIEADVVHRVRFTSDAGQVIHVVVGDLAETDRTRWVDGRPQAVLGTAYPL